MHVQRQKGLFRLIITLMLASIATSAVALDGRLPLTPGGTDYQAYYDPTLNITWLANAFAIAGTPYDNSISNTDGRVDWAAATAWVESLNVNGVTNWRLPKMRPLNGVSFDWAIRSFDGSADFGTARTTTDGTDGGWRDGSGVPLNEMGHMYYVVLGNRGVCNPDIPVCTIQAGWDLVNTGPFSGIQNPGGYWTSTVVGGGVDNPLGRALGVFSPHGGAQDEANEKVETFHAWAVHDGDVDDPAPELCDNGIDDDGDGLVDSADPDCTPPPPPPDSVGLLVRCLHEPIYPQAGEEVTITAQGIDANGDRVLADTLEVYIGDMATPYKSHIAVGGGTGTLLATYTPRGGSFNYGCRALEADKTAQSWNPGDPKLRSVDVGSANNPDWNAQPVIYNGPVRKSIDIVFFADDDEYTSASDPDFLADIHTLIDEGFFTIPWFVEFQWAINFWIATDHTADASPKLVIPGQPIPTSSPDCKNLPPDDFKKRYAWAQAAGIVHRSICRDNARGGVFTIEMQATRLQVVAHEVGHAVFGLADEYCCDGGYFSSKKPLLSSEYKPPFPNLFKSEDSCRDDAVNRPYIPLYCRSLTSSEDSEVWWLGEPAYSGIPRVDQIRDLMQQTGGEDISSVIYDRYQVGDSERDRMGWVFFKCLNGDC